MKGISLDHTGPRVVLTEGKNDAHLILQLCVHFNIPSTFGFYDCNGDDRVLKRLNGLLISPEPPEIIGVVIDADAPDLVSRWQSVSDILLNHGYEPPNAPVETGTILHKENGPSIGVWLMPDNLTDGMLEDFCARLAPEQFIQFATTCVNQALDAGVTTFRTPHLSKAIVHTYLAWQDEPGLPLGLAVKARALNPETEIAHRFQNFLLNLFPNVATA